MFKQRFTWYMNEINSPLTNVDMHLSKELWQASRFEPLLLIYLSKFEDFDECVFVCMWPSNIKREHFYLYLSLGLVIEKETTRSNVRWLQVSQPLAPARWEEPLKVVQTNGKDLSWEPPFKGLPVRLCFRSAAPSFIFAAPNETIQCGVKSRFTVQSSIGTNKHKTSGMLSNM